MLLVTGQLPALFVGALASVFGVTTMTGMVPGASEIDEVLPKLEKMLLEKNRGKENCDNDEYHYDKRCRSKPAARIRLTDRWPLERLCHRRVLVRAAGRCFILNCHVITSQENKSSGPNTVLTNKFPWGLDLHSERGGVTAVSFLNAPKIPDRVYDHTCSI
jgi:hypothetical protein